QRNRAPSVAAIQSPSFDKTARLWDADTGMAIGEPLKGHYGVVNSAAFSPDGKRIITASDDNTVQLWDANTGKPVGEPLQGDDQNLKTAAFSPDGRWRKGTGEDFPQPCRLVGRYGDNTLTVGAEDRVVRISFKGFEWFTDWLAGVG